MIEFELDGTVVSANENFLSMMGYGLDEIVGQHHSIFADPDFAASAEYKEFGAALGRGEYQAAEFKRLGKNGREVWIQATYNPIFDRDGNPFKFVKFATDITEESVSNANHAGQINAINKSQSVIEFELDGTVLSANENFLSIMGYGLDEIVGQHHSSITAFLPTPILRRALSTRSSGPHSGVVSTRRQNSNVSARTAGRSGFRHPTIRFSTATATPTRLSSSLPT